MADSAIIHGRGVLKIGVPIFILHDVTSFRLLYCIDVAGIKISTDGATFAQCRLNRIYESRNGGKFNIWLQTTNIDNSQYEFEATHGDLHINESPAQGALNSPYGGYLRSGQMVAGIDYSQIDSLGNLTTAECLAVNSRGQLQTQNFIVGDEVFSTAFDVTGNSTLLSGLNFSTGVNYQNSGIKLELNFRFANAGSCEMQLYNITDALNVSQLFYADSGAPPVTYQPPYQMAHFIRPNGGFIAGKNYGVRYIGGARIIGFITMYVQR